ncbi:macrolide 2'-phosphotransferase [Sinomonas sp. JGH33]|uniref:Macrolide 2'-phosphotransferase n=1 Tax=Sinomonas terricola TaxID=3110330 RepID=A0ABU5T0W8_9MICC|nr:macrolide 2'-phosphotransferase [Sinomonas sp. JGH33]MEA5453146.1 macrolide 2'-phosphotransferase [Sinomonas sp. JGH33]
MRRTPMELAALATAAVPGLYPVAFGPSPDDATDFDSALLEGADGRKWRVRSPRGTEASARLETEMLVLRAFGPGVRAELPFQLPAVAGTVRLGNLTTCVYTHLAGTVRELDELARGGTRLVRDIGGALAAIHSLSPSLVDRADLPAYSANEFRQRRLNELDQAATTGKIPPILLRRWENALEDVSMWRFNPTVVHGDLHEDNLLVDDGRVTAVTGWTDLRVGDPADDLAWLVASNEPEFIDAVVSAYHEARHEPVDPHLLRRASLAAEFALAQYLVKALSLGDADAAADGEDMLAQLAADIEAEDAAQEAERAAQEESRAAGQAESASQEEFTAAQEGSTAEDPGPAQDVPDSRPDGEPGGAPSAETATDGEEDDADGSPDETPTPIVVAEPATDAIPIVDGHISSGPTR